MYRLPGAHGQSLEVQKSPAGGSRSVMKQYPHAYGPSGALGHPPNEYIGVNNEYLKSFLYTEVLQNSFLHVLDDN